MDNLRGFGSYLSIGLKANWLRAYLNNPKEFLVKNTLGSGQFVSMTRWLRGAELLDKKKKEPTKLCLRLRDIFKTDELFVYQIIITNLFYNSSVLRWYLSHVKWGTMCSSSELKDLVLGINGNKMSKITLSNGINSLLSTLSNTPIGNKLELGIIEKRGRKRFVRKLGTDYVHPIAVAYSLYRYAISKNKRRLTVSELYRDDNKDGGPYLIFGISRPTLENILRWLQENRKGLLKVELSADLDNINLSRKIKDYIDVIGYY